MEISRHNYEVFFIDYFDHTLSPQDVAELLIFLEENQDLMEEFENYENVPIPSASDIIFPSKPELKRHEEKSLFSNDEVIAFLEGDLDQNTKEKFVLKLESDVLLQKQVSLFRKTFLSPDKSVVFIDKKNLKRITIVDVVYRILYFTASIAAILILTIGLYNSFMKNNPTNYTKVSPMPEIKKSPSMPADDTILVLLPVFNNVAASLIIESAKSQPKSDQPIDIHPVLPLQASLIAGLSEKEKYIPQREQFSLLYDYILFKENELNYQKTFAGRFFDSAVKKILPFQQDNTIEEQNKSFISLMIKSFSILTDKEVYFSEITDKSGQVVAYTLNGEKVELARIRRHFQNSPNEKE